MDALSLVILGLAALAGLGAAAALIGAESRDGFERSGHDLAASDPWRVGNGPVFR